VGNCPRRHRRGRADQRDGTINLVHYAAWLVKEMSVRGDQVAIDPRQLKPGELARLLNSTPLGEVISERQLHRHRTRAGFRVAADGDAGKVDLFRYVAWLVTTRHEAIAEAARTPEGSRATTR
jgi:hypothetical protein